MSADFVRVHATCVRLGRAGRAFRAPEAAGILIFGSSGAGKSDLALRLIGLGAKLVADDQTELFLRQGKLHARAPARLAGLMEIRGLGIIEMPNAKSAPVHLAVQLSQKMARMPLHTRYVPPDSLGLDPPLRPLLLVLDPREASAADKVGAAAAHFAREALRSVVKKE